MYSRKVKKLLMNPVNGKSGSFYNGQGKSERTVCCRTNPNKVSKNKVEFNVCVEGVRGINNTIFDANWRVFGDPVAMATCSWCVYNIRNISVIEARNILAPEKAALDLGITDELDIRSGCKTAIDAALKSLDDYQNKYRGS